VKKLKVVNLTAASLYLASILNGETISQTAFSNASGVSSVTIRNRVTSIREGLNL